jgi:hypothetical protein
MAAGQVCGHLPGEMINLIAKGADRARIERKYKPFSRSALRYFTHTWRNNSSRCLLRRLPRHQDAGLRVRLVLPETGLQEKQVGAPTVPWAVIRGSNKLEDFRCQIHVKVSHCVTSISFLNWHIFGYFVLFGTFLGHRVTLCHSVTHVMGVHLVTCVTLVTNIIVMCHWSSNVP